MLDAKNSIPLYLQLKETIKSKIDNGEYKKGTQLPTEIELSETYNISRITVRKAISSLCDEGLLVKKQGKGTFIQSKQIVRNKMDHLLSFTKACTNSGMEPSTQIISKSLVNLDKKTADHFKLFEGMPMIKIVRLRFADDIPVMYEINYYPSPKYNFLMTEELKGSIYALLKDKYDIEIKCSRDTYLDVIKADHILSESLNVAYGEPLYVINNKIFDVQDRLAHVGFEYIVCERYRFNLNDQYV